MPKKTILLSPEEMLSLLTEKSIKKDGITISASCSFLAIMSLLEHKFKKNL